MLDLPGKAGILCHAMPHRAISHRAISHHAVPCRAMLCAVPEGCSHPAAQQGAALLVSILPRSPAGNYREIKNGSESNFSSSQVWAETCDPMLTEMTEPGL